MSKVKRLQSQFSRRAFAPHPLPFAGCRGRKSAAGGEGGRSPLGAAPPGPCAPPGGPRIDPKPS